MNWIECGRKDSLSNLCPTTELLRFHPLRWRHWWNQNKNLPPSFFHIPPTNPRSEITARQISKLSEDIHSTSCFKRDVKNEVMNDNWKTNLSVCKLRRRVLCWYSCTGTWWKWVVSVTLQPLYLREISSLPLDSELLGRCLVEEINFYTLPRIEPRLLRRLARSLAILLSILSQFPWMVSGYELVYIFFENYKISRDFLRKY